MVTVQLPEHLAKRLQQIAERENRSVADVAVSILEDHVPAGAANEVEVSSEDDNPLDAILGMFDDDVTDLSSRDEEILREYYKQKYGRPD